jgi:hypothetical protein
MDRVDSGTAIMTIGWLARIRFLRIAGMSDRR